MITALVIAAAVSISSPEIGNFFDIPAWMPTHVPSDRTFGSKDMTNATHRIDDTALAAVNACFEAAAERCYYSLEGQSNRWSLADYGPTTKMGFRFSLGAPEDLLCYLPDTNRVISTRRLSEYDNLNRLAMTISGDHENVADSFSMFRPTWNRRQNLEWSSSSFDTMDVGFGITSGFPDLDWDSPDGFCSSYGSNEWASAMMIWSQLSFADKDVVNWCPSQHVSVASIPSRMFGNTTFGEYDDGYALLGRGMRALSNTVDVIGRERAATNVVERSYKRPGDPLYITEDVIPKVLQAIPRSDWMSCTSEVVSVQLWFSYQTSHLPEWATFDRETMSFVMSNSLCFVVCAWDRPDVSGDEWEDWSDIAIEQFEVPFGTTTAALQHVPVGRFSFGYPGESYLNQDFIVNLRVSVDTLAYSIVESGYLYYDLVPAGFPAELVKIEYDWEKTNRLDRVLGVDSITNDTRRLFTDRMSSIGMALSSLNRTYCRVAVPWTGLATNVHNIVTAHASATNTFTVYGWYESYSGTLEAIGDDGDIPPLNKTWSTNTSYTTSLDCGNGIFKRVTPTTSGMRCELSVLEETNTIVRLSEDTLRNAIVSYENEHGWLSGVIRTDVLFNAMTISGNPFSAVATLQIVDYEQGPSPSAYHAVRRGTISFPISVQPPLELPCIVAADVTREYDFAENADTVLLWRDGYPTHPGFDGYSLAQSPCLGLSMLSSGMSVGSRSTPITSDYPDIRVGFSSKYRTMSGTHSTERGFHRFVGDCRTELEDECGSRLLNQYPTYRNPTVFADCDSSGSFSRTISHLKLGTTGYTFQAKLSDDAYMYTAISFDMPSVTPVDAVIRGTDTHVSPSFPATLSRVIYTCGSNVVPKQGYEYSPNEHYGAVVRGYIDTWSKVDWNWKALKRGD